MSGKQITSPPQANAEAVVNANNAALGQGFLWAHDEWTSTALTVAFFGGTFDGNTVAAATVDCTDDDDNYIVAHRTTRVLSTSTATTNWANTGTYGRVGRAVFVGGVLTYYDERYSVGGIFDHSAALTAAADADTDFTFTSDTGSTADSDPGAGLFKWNNGTQASATFLYFDDSTADAVSLATYFGSLPKNGLLHIVQDDDDTKWQTWAWTAAPVDGTGYRKFAVVLQASGGSIADGKACSVRFDASPGVAVPVVAGFMYPGAPTASALVGLFAAPAGTGTLTFSAAIAGSSGIALTAATAQTDIDVRKNAATSSGGSSVGTIRWAAAGTVPTFIAASGFTLTGGTDYLSFWAPATPDATLANFGASIYGTRAA
jgi:hypothetical protein